MKATDGLIFRIFFRGGRKNLTPWQTVEKLGPILLAPQEGLGHLFPHHGLRRLGRHASLLRRAKPAEGMVSPRA